MSNQEMSDPVMSERATSDQAIPDQVSPAASPAPSPDQIRQLLDSLYRQDSGRILATLIRLLGDFDLAEEAMHEAFAAALTLWPATGVPDNPRPWLISTARFKAIDSLRRRSRWDASQADLAHHLESQWSSAQNSTADPTLDHLEDDRLRLIFTCCHPSLAPDAQVALTLREVCGLTTEEIAKAFLVTPNTLAQRIVRAKARIRDTHIPYEVPSPDQLPERLGAVLQVIYLVFNEGYSAAAGAEVTRADLTAEAIRLARLLVELHPTPQATSSKVADSKVTSSKVAASKITASEIMSSASVDPEVLGLLALMLLQESRRAARTSSTGELILLENQDRSLWNHAHIAEGVALVEKALGFENDGSANPGGADIGASKPPRLVGPYTLQAAIAAVHAEAESSAATDWRQIVALYNHLARIQPSPVVHLNRAVAIAMRDGPEAGLVQVDAVLEHWSGKPSSGKQGDLTNYYLAHAARADMYRRLGRTAEARASYEKALSLTQQEPERQFLQERIRQLK